MIATQPRSSRLEEVLAFAAAYRGWTARQLATALDRDPSNLVPDSGVPKLDLMLRLAETLDWDVADLVELLARDLGFAAAPSRLGPATRPPASPGPNRRAIEALQHALHATADTHAMGGIRATATMDDVGSADDGPNRAMVLLRLAQAYHHAGNPLEGRAVAGEALASIEWLLTPDAAALRARTLVLRASCASELVELMRSRQVAARARDASASSDCMPAAGCCTPGLDRDIAGIARASLADLERAVLQLDHPATADRLSSPAALRHRAVAVRRQLEEVIDPGTGRDSLRALLTELDAVIDVDQFADRELLESHGWSCIGGFALAERHATGSSLQQALGILSNKADEIASTVDSWALRERVLTLEHARRKQLVALGVVPTTDNEWLLDRDDLRAVIGCIGNSRRFRHIGLDILRNATVVDCEPLELVRRPRSTKAVRRTRKAARPTPTPTVVTT